MLSTDKLVVIATTLITLTAVVINPNSGMDLARYVTAGLIGYLGKEIATESKSDESGKA